jgi:hypothetical protein
MVAPTCFGITLPSSGSVPSAFWEILNRGAVDRILWMGVLCLVTWCACFVMQILQNTVGQTSWYYVFCKANITCGSLLKLVIEFYDHKLTQRMNHPSKQSNLVQYRIWNRDLYEYLCHGFCNHTWMLMFFFLIRPSDITQTNTV